MNKVSVEAAVKSEKIDDAMIRKLDELESAIKGDINYDFTTRLLYATDASAYREIPLAVCRPAEENDIVRLVEFAKQTGITLIPRAAGTSLAGQVVGTGLVMDISRYFNDVIQIDARAGQVRLQPGVILDELNLKLKPHGLFFSPETSTSNRCMIGGMIGNNSSGLHSVVYGSTREHLNSVRVVLSDASIAEFGPLNQEEFEEKCKLQNLEGKLYRHISSVMLNKEIREEIFEQFPDPDVVRRNTGYALDELANTRFFSGKQGKHEKFNFCRLIAGSEGTLGIVTEATLNLDPLPPPVKALIPIHVNSVMEAIRGNVIALKHSPAAVELMDKKILDLTKGNISQNRNRFFVKGDPGAILIVEFQDESIERIHDRAEAMKQDFVNHGIGSHFPLITGEDIPRVWALRKAGLGVLSKMQGDAKPVSVIEDTSVTPYNLESYISEFNVLLESYKLECVYHAHISVGELHLRPVLNLKEPGDVELFHTIAKETALLVKKYRGSLSGEHGDGRLRGEFIPLMVGERVYGLLCELKSAWDPDGIFNQGKIIDSPPMNTHLRHTIGAGSEEPETFFDFSSEGGIIRHIEQCNGSGDCRKTEITGGTMCPSYMALKDENATTRARANVLREFIGKPGKNAFDHEEIYKILDLCLSCKACKSECPSSVDMAKLKAEFLQHWYDVHGIPLRTRLIANITAINAIGAGAPHIFNFFAGNKLFSGVLKRIIGFSTNRSIPKIQELTVRKWVRINIHDLNKKLPVDAPEVTYFVDEFTNYNDADIGIKTIKFLHALGIRVFVYQSGQSGRTFLSKGLLKEARKIARKNISALVGLVHEERPLIGTEPSAILSFRDEYPEISGKEYSRHALEIGKHAYLLEEYIVNAWEQGKINKNLFSNSVLKIKVHGHCQQKALTGTNATLKMLSIPANYDVTEIPSGCCGMAGSFGYEKEHYELSMKVGELVLFPEIRSLTPDTVIVAPGTSCRHQIKDGTGAKAKHPVEIMFEALKPQ